MSAYLNDVVLLYLRELIDWESYFVWRKGEDADIESDRDALRDVLETAAKICSGLEESMRAGWYETARLEGDQVVYPAHIANAVSELSNAGLISFGVEERYDGFELPSFVSNVILQMISRADAGLMTMCRCRLNGNTVGPRRGHSNPLIAQ